MNRYGNEVTNTLKYGTMLVNIPVSDHELGKIELPGWLQREDPRKHFFIESLIGMSTEAFRELIKGRISQDASDVLVFVHGYNNSMKFACLRAAQVQHDIQFAGPTVVFSWPSQGTVRGYWQDETAAAQSTDAFVELMRELFRAQTGVEEPGRVHIIAHSMGNRVVLEGLARIAQANPPRRASIGHVVLAAPDVDHSQFLLDFPRAAQLSESITMYFCREDKALLASQKLHNDSRIGQVLVPLPPLTNIDAAKANTSILGHDYFASRSPLLIDLEMHIVMGYPPAKRPTLRTAELRGHKYWQFP